MPADVLLKAAARQGHRIPSEPEQRRKLLRQLTHLHLDGLQLQQLQSLKLCPRLQVAAVGGLQDLGLLQKLYLQGNCLTCIDQLSACSRLEELHVSDQHWQQPPEDTEPEQQQQQQQQQQQHCEQHCDEQQQPCQQQKLQLAVQQLTSQDAAGGSRSSSAAGNHPEQHCADHGLHVQPAPGAGAGRRQACTMPQACSLSLHPCRPYQAACVCCVQQTAA
ncbi:hypothetical protein COO60DRAFT_1125971 [Scenedesmus sp. NREL 46B-D3]|nr:hypothetical protein COO60DRAFT_1125971 [Scenedesmus sp. NREL 46B-D3]